MATARDKKAGNILYKEGRAQLVRADSHSAFVRVDDGQQMHECTFQLLPTRQVSAACTCTPAYTWAFCQHRVAAVQALHDYLKEHPPSMWRAVLEAATRPTTRRGVAASQAAIIFSLDVTSDDWRVAPYVLSARHIPAGTRRDRDSLVVLIEQKNLQREARPLSQRVSPNAYPQVTPEAIAAANLALTANNNYSGYYGYGYGNNSSRSLDDTILALLSHCVVFSGTASEPLAQPIRVRSTPGRLELELNERNEHLVLECFVVVDDERLPVDTSIYVLNETPLWVLANDLLLPLDDPSGNALALLDFPQLSIPLADRDDFLDSFLLPLAERVVVRGDMLEWQEIDSEPTPRLYLSEQDSELCADLKFVYENYVLPYEKSLPTSSTRRSQEGLQLAQIKRRSETEQAAWQSLSNFGLKRGNDAAQFLLRKNMAAIDFLARQVPKLLSEGFEIYGEENLSTARINREKPTIGFKVSSGIDWFDVQASVRFGEQTVPFKLFKRALRRREKFIKLADGSLGVIPEEWLDRYRTLINLAEEHDDGLRVSGHHFALLEGALSEADVASTDAAFEERRSQLRAFQQIDSQPTPQHFHGELRPYQKAGFDWLHFLHDYNLGGILADDMGTGKTPTTLAFLQSLHERAAMQAATLIVMPRSLLFNWERETLKFTPQLRTYSHADQGRISDPSAFGHYDLVFTTYGVLLRDIELLRGYRFHYTILDEAQAIKNPLAETSRVVRLLNAEHRLTLTGTPVENSTLELWSQFAFLNPGLLGSLDFFREEFVNKIERQQDEEAATTLRKLVYPFILRRTKDQVALDLPPRSEELLICEMEPAQRRLYNQQRDYYRDLLRGLIEEEGLDDARLKILEGLLRLRQICNHPRLVEQTHRGGSGKFELLIDTLQTLRAEGHKALIFSQFVQMLTIIRSEFDARGIPYAYLDGSTRKREEEVDRFQQTPELPFFLISLKAGGVGLNLTAADYVIHVDPWWNPAVEMQATDRTHRIGQTKPVFVYKMITRDSVEEKIVQLQDQKRALVSQLISAESSFFKALTRDDVDVLFS